MLKASMLTGALSRALQHPDKVQTQPANIPRPVHRDTVMALEKQFEYLLGTPFPIGEKMVARGVWTIVEEEA
ncbi:MAG: hypothetical protein PHQ81_08170 [Methanofollis sp.]|nr:hypothetical protein [Methanofollis sp.]